MLKVGLTGGIGSGKTYVSKLFHQLGVPIYYADDRAKYLMNHDAQLIAELKTAFGDNIYIDGQLDRPQLAAKVFNNPEQLAILNSLVHPAVFRDTQQWLAEHADKPYTLREAALVFETGMNHLLDKVITVTAPIELRIERAMKRDHITREDVLARINNQMDEQEKVRLADFVIHNDGINDVLAQVQKIHGELVGMAK